MQIEFLKILDLAVGVGNTSVLMGPGFCVKSGNVHVVMGPNGSGKSTLAQVIAGNPVYRVTSGDILVDGKSILGLTPDERARLGIFVSFQYPPEIPGVNVASYLRMIFTKKLSGSGLQKSTDSQSQKETTGNQSQREATSSQIPQSLSPVKFRAFLMEKLELLDMDKSFWDRYLNEGFSGGEKKKMELLQMLVLEPRLVILDEIDSGLDIDALKCVAKAINWLRWKNPETAFIIITHHARILDHIRPDFVHIMKAGKIVKSGGFELAGQLEKTGYKEFGEGPAQV